MYLIEQSTQRPAKMVPVVIICLLVVSLGAQIWFHSNRDEDAPVANKLPNPPGEVRILALSGNDAAAAAKVLMLWLQAFDNQPGVSIPFQALNYDRLVEWLSLILRLDANSSYPLLAASRVYAEVADQDKQKKTLQFVAQAFVENPGRRWQWMAHAVFVAKHRMRDLPYALELARLLADYGDRASNAALIPNWAKQMVIFVHEDMGDIEAAKVLLGGLLESGKITDPNEQWFLSHRLAEMEAQDGK